MSLEITDKEIEVKIEAYIKAINELDDIIKVKVYENDNNEASSQALYDKLNSYNMCLTDFLDF